MGSVRLRFLRGTVPAFQFPIRTVRMGMGVYCQYFFTREFMYKDWQVEPIQLSSVNGPARYEAMRTQNAPSLASLWPKTHNQSSDHQIPIIPSKTFSCGIQCPSFGPKRMYPDDQEGQESTAQGPGPKLFVSKIYPYILELRSPSQHLITFLEPNLKHTP